MRGQHVDSAQKARSPRRPTIRDVAALAGVSKSLVSLVFSDPEKVSDVRRLKVMAAADQLGYTPNFLARSLAAEGGTFVGILVEDLHNPFIGELVDHCRAYLEEHNEGAFVTSARLIDADGNWVIDRLAVNALIDLRPKAIIAVGSIPEVESLKRVAKTIPIICASDIPRGIERASSVRTDDTEGMRLVIDHLVSQGHRRIHNIKGPPAGSISLTRQAAYERAMLANGLEDFIHSVSVSDASENGGYEAALELLQQNPRPTAITCYNDLQAIGAQQALQEHEQATGEKIAITGYDNTYMSNLKQISLTTIEPQNKMIAEKAVSIVLENLRHPAAKGHEYLLKPQLIIRNSSLNATIG
jgi:DNA-binding LacI/PurR family transcriptional regulator